MRISLLRVAVLCGLSLTATLRGDEGPRPPSGEVRLGSGRVVEYTVHFDRNSLRDSLRLDDGLIALTTSGALLRYELPAIRLVRERIDTEEVTCLGRGEGGAVLAGLGDGRVCRVDPATLGLADVVKFPAAPSWIGWDRARGNRPAGLVVVTRATRPFEHDGRHWDMPNSVVNDLVTGKTFALEDEASTVLLDRAGRVWLGADRGEWGGRITRVDLVQGTVAVVPPPPSRDPDEKAFWEGVYGFIERPDGQVWAFGGTSHMGLNSGEITRIDGAKPQRLFAFDPPQDPDREPKPDPNRPLMPITQIVADDGGLLVFSYSDVFRVDDALKSWKKAATLDIEYRWGRPDAVGSYPSVVAVHPPRRAGEPYLLATVGDGYVRLEGARATAHRLPGQLGASRVVGVKNTSEGPLFFEGDNRLPVWRLGANGWEIAAIDPPFEFDPDDEFKASRKDEDSWYETKVLVGPGGAITTVSGTAWSDGTRTTARRVDGRSERIGRETSSLDPSDSFLTADGTLWNASYDALKRFEKGRWEPVAHWPRGEGPSRPVALNLNTNGPPWLLLDRFVGNLWRLDHGARGDDPQLTRLDLREGGKALRIVDAIPWTDGALLLATAAGLRVYAPGARTLARVDFPEPEHPATALARDGRGRLWFGGGHGLALVEPGARALETFDRVPWVRRSEVDALSPDPRHDDGVIVALGSRGVAFVRAGPKP